jgi:hypothetical protein
LILNKGYLRVFLMQYFGKSTGANNPGDDTFLHYEIEHGVFCSLSFFNASDFNASEGSPALSSGPKPGSGSTSGPSGSTSGWRQVPAQLPNPNLTSE